MTTNKKNKTGSEDKPKGRLMMGGSRQRTNTSHGARAAMPFQTFGGVEQFAFGVHSQWGRGGACFHFNTHDDDIVVVSKLDFGKRQTEGDGTRVFVQTRVVVLRCCCHLPHHEREDKRCTTRRSLSWGGWFVYVALCARVERSKDCDEHARPLKYSKGEDSWVPAK